LRHMDYVTRQFINLAKRLLRDSRKAFTSLGVDLHHIKNAIKSIDKNTRANQQKEQPKIEVVALVHEPEGAEAKRKAEYDRTQRRDRIRLMVEWLTFFAVFFYGYMAVRQWREQISARHQTQGAVDAANRNAAAAEKVAITAENTFNLAREQFRVEERPWVVAFGKVTPGVQAVMPQPLLGGVELTIRVVGKNVGKTPAVDIAGMPYELRIRPTKLLRQELESFVPNYTDVSPGANIPPSEGQSEFVFPSKDSPYIIKAEIFKKIQTGELTAYFVGAIRYHDLFKPKIEPYETLFCVVYKPQGLPVGDCPAGKFSIK
jgi:hypothetical protein